MEKIIIVIRTTKGSIIKGTEEPRSLLTTRAERLKYDLMVKEKQCLQT